MISSNDFPLGISSSQPVAGFQSHACALLPRRSVNELRGVARLRHVLWRLSLRAMAGPWEKHGMETSNRATKNVFTIVYLQKIYIWIWIWLLYGLTRSDKGFEQQTFWFQRYELWFNSQKTVAYPFSNKPIQRMCHHGFKTTSKPVVGEIWVINRLRALDISSHTIAVFLFIHANAYPRKWDRK